MQPLFDHVSPFWRFGLGPPIHDRTNRNNRRIEFAQLGFVQFAVHAQQPIVRFGNATAATQVATTRLTGAVTVAVSIAFVDVVVIAIAALLTTMLLMMHSIFTVVVTQWVGEFLVRVFTVCIIVRTRPVVVRFIFKDGLW
jgi:hypothetical protein